MHRRRLDIALEDEAATRRFAEDIAISLRPGDVLALSGELGAGKSTFARALIRAVADDLDLDVPSPTFTLAQTYALRLPIVHFDLYRLTDPEELAELGLDEAVADGAALIEWPERAESALPSPAVWLAFSDGDTPDSRALRIEGPDAAVARIERSLEIRTFLASVGRGDAVRRHLLGDASSRAYEILRTGETPDPILMNAPQQPDGPPVRNGLPYPKIAHLAENVTPFVAIARWLKSEGFAAPAIIDADLNKGLLIVENLGAGSFLSPSGEPVESRYQAAAAALAELHRRPVPHVLPVDGEGRYTLPPYDRGAMMIEVELLLDWYLEFRRGHGPSDDERDSFVTLWNKTIAGLAASEKHIVLRDYHSPNLIWRDGRLGIDRLGILDFQDAMIGPSAYDLAALVQDARVTIPAAMAERLVESYLGARPSDADFDEATFRTTLATMQAQRASKILGIFVRLDRRDRKPAYLKHLPRIQRYLAAALSHEALIGLRGWYEEKGLLPDSGGDS